MAETADTQKLIALIEANTKSYERAMARLEGVTQNAVRKSQSSFRQLEASLDKVGLGAKRMLGFFGLASAGAAMAGISKLVSQTARMQDVADKTGVAMKALQELNYAAGQTGVEFTDLDKALNFLGKNMGKAAVDGGQLANTLKANGVAITDSKGNMRPLNDLFMEMADLVKNAGSETEQITLATMAFGRAGGDMVNMLKLGSDGLRAMGVEAAKTGAIIDDQSAKAIANLDDKLNALSKTFTANAVPAIATFLGKVNELWETLSQPFTKNTLGWLIFGGVAPGNIAGGADYNAGHDRSPVLNNMLGQSGRKTIIAPSKTPKDNPTWDDPLDVSYVKVKKLKTETEQFVEIFKDGLSNIGSTLMGVARGTESLGDAMTRVVNNIQDMLADKAFQMIINAMFSGGFSFGGGVSFARNPNPLQFGGPRAGGGPMMAGKGYLVGEQGPEWVMPGRSSYVVPNGKMGGGGGSQIHMHFEQGIQAEQRTSNGPQGERVDIMIKRMVRQEISGAMKPTLRDQYGITPISRRRY